MPHLDTGPQAQRRAAAPSTTLGPAPISPFKGRPGNPSNPSPHFVLFFPLRIYVNLRLLRRRRFGAGMPSPGDPSGTRHHSDTPPPTQPAAAAIGALHVGPWAHRPQQEVGYSQHERASWPHRARGGMLGHQEGGSHLEKTGISRVTCSSLWNGRVECPTQKPLHLEKSTDPLPMGSCKQRPVWCVSGPTPSLPALPSAGHTVHPGSVWHSP